MPNRLKPPLRASGSSLSAGRQCSLGSRVGANVRNSILFAFHPFAFSVHLECLSPLSVITGVGQPYDATRSTSHVTSCLDLVLRLRQGALSVVPWR